MDSEEDSNEDDNIQEFFEEAGEEELKKMVSLADKTETFGYEEIKDMDEPISPKIWGLAIEKEVLEPNNEGYTLNYRSDIVSHISGDQNKQADSLESSSDQSIDPEDLPDVDHSDAKWNRKDKIVTALGALGILGFSIDPVQETIYGIMGLPLNPLLDLLPFTLVILGIAFVTSLWSVIVREVIIDTDASEFREKINKIKGDDGGSSLFGVPDDSSEEEQERLIRLQQDMMKTQLRPFGWTLVITIPFIIWIFTVSNLGDVGSVTYPIIGTHLWAGTVIGPIKTWITWYAPCSALGSQIIRKLYDFENLDIIDH